MIGARPIFLAKTAPKTGSVGDIIQLDERSMYEGHLVRPGDQIYVWYSETKGGRGLAFRGEVQKRHAISSTVKFLELTVVLIQELHGFTVRDLEHFRDIRTDEPLSTLSAKLYRQSHDKICLISPVEAEFLALKVPA